MADVGKRRAGTTVVAVVLAIAAGIVTRPHWLFIDNANVRAALETAAGLGTLTAGWITLLRAERTRAASDVALVVAIGLVSFTSIVLATLTVVGLDSGPSIAWLALPARLSAGALLLAAGHVGRVFAEQPPRRSSLLIGTAASAAVLAGIGGLLGSITASAKIPMWLELATAVLYLAGGIALSRRAARTGERALTWYAAAGIALVATRLIFVLLPAPGPDWLSPGDLARLVVSGLLLMAASKELGESRGQAMTCAVDQERRRLAREIHDGLAQELAFIVSQSRRLTARAPRAEELDLLARAGQAALSDARRAIFALKRSSRQGLGEMIVEQAVRIADRAGLVLDVEVQRDGPVDAEVEHAILRIVSEAIGNAARHGRASRVSLHISCEGERVAVRISDDGGGFEPRAARPRRSFGLTSMAERAESVGGRLHVQSRRGAGTTIEVAI